MPRSTLLTIEEVAAYLRLNRFTVYRMAERGELPGAKIARRWRFGAKDIQLWFEQQKRRTVPHARKRVSRSRKTKRR